MIAITLFIGALLFAGSMIFISGGIPKAVWVTIGLILTVGSIGLMILNYSQYLGMKKVTVQQTYPLTSSITAKKPVLLYHPIGTQNERVYLYKTNPLEHGLQRTNPTQGPVQVTRNASRNQLKVTKTYRVYKSEELRLLFSTGVQNHEYVMTQWHFSLKPGWQLVSTR
ncbi:DUF4811 domain-containing protein [Secundilactobacillus silagei]|uniref:DUF4811 domain-containing protein n=1 Tax=Secundilactobacillus silagei JCM 19001 TaxID=1302250 RepID=A0A1Z5H392_9LACO|nr:DUF4811 domain-containing protein [Secundilactobacillus silagei]TDG70451.1 hypothetical protein C5L25_001641 [Secundilactobacillus silagei JCM 19001]GAT17778.1 hypothetical protein IWT126_00034 [Secundilactobacillus silagei JCM 19001]